MDTRSKRFDYSFLRVEGGDRGPRRRVPSRSVWRRAGPRPGRLPGFTLIEIMVTLAVMGVLIVGVALSLDAVDTGSRLRRAAEDLDVFLSGLSSQAAIQQIPWQVVIQPQGSTVHVTSLGSDEDEWAGLDHELPGGVVIDAVRLDGQTAQDRAVSVIIQPSGYLRAVDVRLSFRGALVWARWDPLARRVLIEEAS